MTHYDRLKVARTATPEQIKTAYYQRAAENHPDKTGNDPAKLEEMKRITAAYAVLSDPKKRAEYDGRPPGLEYLDLLTDGLTEGIEMLEDVQDIARTVSASVDRLKQRIADRKRRKEQS